MKNKRKLYDIELDEEEMDEDIIQLTLRGSQAYISEVMEQYKSNAVPDGQNKYNYLFRTLNPCLTPFAPPTNFTNVISERTVQSNVDTIINNLDDFYSSVVENDNVGRTRFVIEKYNLGLNQLHRDEKKKKNIPPEIISLTPNDRGAVTGILTLKEPALLYSHINLPNTSLLMKSHLNLVTFNYWSLLKQNTEIIEDNISLGEKRGPIEENFLQAIKAFLFQETMSFDDRNKSTAYKQFLNNIIPT